MFQPLHSASESSTFISLLVKRIKIERSGCFFKAGSQRPSRPHHRPTLTGKRGATHNISSIFISQKVSADSSAEPEESGFLSKHSFWGFAAPPHFRPRVFERVAHLRREQTEKRILMSRLPAQTQGGFFWPCKSWSDGRSWKTFSFPVQQSEAPDSPGQRLIDYFHYWLKIISFILEWWAEKSIHSNTVRFNAMIWYLDIKCKDGIFRTLWYFSIEVSNEPLALKSVSGRLASLKYTIQLSMLHSLELI